MSRRVGLQVNKMVNAKPSESARDLAAGLTDNYVKALAVELTRRSASDRLDRLVVSRQRTCSRVRAERIA